MSISETAVPARTEPGIDAYLLAHPCASPRERPGKTQEGGVGPLEPDAPADDISRQLRRLFHGAGKFRCLVAPIVPDDKVLTAVSRVVPLSDEPPAILICVTRQSRLYSELISGVGFFAHLVREDGLASPLPEPAENGEAISPGRAETLLGDAVATVTCEQNGRYLYGTDAIFIGRVTGLDVR